MGMLNITCIAPGDCAGRFSRPGLHNKEEIMGVGSVGQHLEQTGLPSSLNFERVNRIPLIDQGEEFTCTLFFQPSMASFHFLALSMYLSG
jgi:hypothetical protein